MKHLTKLTKRTPAVAATEYPDWFCETKGQLRDFVAQFGIPCCFYEPKCGDCGCGVVE
jgi:hypothetical protein